MKKYLILVLVMMFALTSCISTTMSSGAKSETEAKAEAGVQSGQKASSVEDAELSTGEMTIVIRDDKGKPIAEIKTAPTTAKSGSRTSQQTDTESIASAHAKASSEAFAKAVKSMWWFMVILVIASLFTVVSRIPSLWSKVKKLFV